jgi:hypothetical protein
VGKVLHSRLGCFKETHTFEPIDCGLVHYRTVAWVPRLHSSLVTAVVPLWCDSISSWCQSTWSVVAWGCPEIWLSSWWCFGGTLPSQRPRCRIWGHSNQENVIGGVSNGPLLPASAVWSACIPNLEQCSTRSRESSARISLPSSTWSIHVVLPIMVEDTAWITDCMSIMRLWKICLWDIFVYSSHSLPP